MKTIKIVVFIIISAIMFFFCWPIGLVIITSGIVTVAIKEENKNKEEKRT